MHPTQRIAQLLFKKLSNELTNTEFTELESWITESEENRSLYNELTDDVQLHDDVKLIFKSRELVYEKVQSVIEGETVIPMRKYPLWKTLAAAATIILAGVGVWYYIDTESIPAYQTVSIQPVNDAVPGKEGATLTLSDGSLVILDSAANGALTDQGNVRLEKKNGLLAYTSTQESSELHFNTMSTAKGRQFQLSFSDGSKAWLNAASSVTFPASFSGKERRVEVTGEVYFEVAPLFLKGTNKRVPFIVNFKTPSGGEGEVEVLGTRFNLNCYNDENVARTTLLEGKVRVSEGKSSQKLNPLQQSVHQADGKITILDDVDVNAVTAWKNGYFQFDDADLPSVLRQLSRWYDVEIEYNGKLPERHFRGKLQRNLLLSQVLKILKQNEVDLSIEGKKIIVQP